MQSRSEIGKNKSYMPRQTKAGSAGRHLAEGREFQHPLSLRKGCGMSLLLFLLLFLFLSD
jgi:hypothetical protein